VKRGCCSSLAATTRRRFKVTEKDPRTYVRIHDGMPDHPKVDGLSDAAFRLLVTMWCWCSRHLTDGKIPVATWEKRGKEKVRAELVAAGLVDLVDDGSVYMHDYTDHQRTAEEVKQLREARREAGRMGGIAKAKKVANAKASAKANAVANGKQTGSKPMPETETDTELLTNVSSLGARIPRSNGRATRIPDPWIVDDAMKDWALERGMQPQWVMKHTERFVNYWTAKAGKDGTKTDWRATWRNWLLTEQDKNPVAPVSRNPNGYAGDDVRARFK
jgi:hypothetical protein